MRQWERGTRKSERGTSGGVSCRTISHFCSAFRVSRSAFFASLLLVSLAGAGSPQSLPPLPDTTGFGVHVLALARAPDGAIWVGSYGQGLYVLRPGAGTWEHIGKSADTAARSISWDLVHAFGFGPSAETRARTVGNGGGPSPAG